ARSRCSSSGWRGSTSPRAAANAARPRSRTAAGGRATAIAMKAKLKDLILRLLKEHRVMTIATNRPDGWPQATMVGYVNDGLLLYCFVARDSQKHANILRDPRVSIAIGSDASLPLDVSGLSLAARVRVVDDRGEWERIAALRLKRYPEYAALP